MDYFHLNVDREQLLSMSSLGLAHLGDGVFEVMVRSWIALHLSLIHISEPTRPY